MQQVVVNMQYSIVGETFGARGCSSSCSCNPCDCNPCNCGKSNATQPDYPSWRISGYALRRGYIDDVDIAQHLLISLALPQDKNMLSGPWSEVLLVDEQATDEQVQALLTLFEDQLHSFPAEIGVQASLPRAIYRVPIQYRQSGAGPHLSLAFLPTECQLVRQGESPVPLDAWMYQGPVALREIFRSHS